MQQQLDAAKQGGATGFRYGANAKTALSSLSSAGSDASMVGLGIDLMYLLYLVPIGALFILYREWIGQPMPLASLVVGGLGVFGFLLAYVTSAMERQRRDQEFPWAARFRRGTRPVWSPA